jgi:8-oxo-dGTP pyrophosphatase MutT (NUDIX family)
LNAFGRVRTIPSGGSMAREAREHGPDVSRAALLTSAGALVDFLAAALPATSSVPARDPLIGPGDRPRHSAVLVPLYARGGTSHLLFTKRSPALSTHSGQISFPGGSRDPEDASLETTALREAQEELAIPPQSVRVLGALSPVFTVVSNFLITPVVGWLGSEPLAVAPNPQEVAEVIEAPLAVLADPAIFHQEEWVRAGQPHPVYFYDFGPYRIWGATARILHELLALLPE